MNFKKKADTSFKLTNYVNIKILVFLLFNFEHIQL